MRPGQRGRTALGMPEEAHSTQPGAEGVGGGSGRKAALESKKCHMQKELVNILLP
jgi:hypothetical protein